MQTSGISWRLCRAFVRHAVMLFLLFGLAQTAYAAYGKVTKDSNVDPSIMKIDEAQYLGTKVSGDYVLLDANGREFRLGDMQGKPLVLALSYYTCDGACPTLNRNLFETLDSVNRWKMGQDYQVLTLSFDRNDAPKSLKMFMHHTGFKKGLPEGWKMAVFRNPEDIKRLTASMGYRFFWSPRDAMFLHPSVYIMLSPEGRITRYLYGTSVGAKDMEISITKALGSEISPANVINFVLGACYSYNYKEGKYTVNIPLFVAAGGLIFGVSLIVIGFTVMKRRREKNENQVHYA